MKTLSDVKPEVRLRDQLDLDSMDFLDIVMELRKQHGIDVPEAEYRELRIFGKLWKLLLPKFEAGAAAYNGKHLIFPFAGSYHSAPKKTLRSSHNWCRSVWAFRRLRLAMFGKKVIF